MRLARLRLTNFRQHADTEIEFDSGLTGIIGPNGAGKSTLLEAIAWALYGSTAARGTADSIRFARAEKRAPVRVELDFELAGHRYRVVRGLSMAELYLDGGDEPIANSVSAVAELLQRRLGMTRTEFFNTYFTGQKELAVMQALTSGERAQFLSRVLGYEKLRVAQDLCGAHRKELASEIAGLRAGMPERDAVMRQAQENAEQLREADARVAQAERAEHETRDALASVAPRWLAAQTGREERQRLQADLAAIAAEDSQLQRNAELRAQDLAQVVAARAELLPLQSAVTRLDEVSVALDEQRILAAGDGRRRALESQRLALSQELGGIEARLARQREATEKIGPLTVTLTERRQALDEANQKYEARRTEWVRDKQAVESRRQALLEQYDELKGQQEKLIAAGEAGDCPTCKRPLGEHFRGVLDVLERQLETVTSDGKYFRSRLDQLAEPPADLAHLEDQRRRLQEEVDAVMRELSELQAEAKQAGATERELRTKVERVANIAAELASIPGGYDAELHRQLDAERASLADKATLANRLATRVEREPALRREVEHIARQREELAARRAAAEERLAALTIPDGDYVELKRLHDGVAAAHAEAGQQAAAARSARELAARLHDASQQSLAEYEALAAKLEALEDQRRLHDELHRAFNDLRTELNAQLRPELSEVASAFLTELTDARYTELELDDKYRLTVLEEGVPKPVISGGEEDIANLVLRLAISQMIAERAGQPFSLLVLDEVFGSLDDVRRQNVIGLLRGLHDRFDQVIVITHIEGVRDGLDRVISVGFDEATGAARVTPGDELPTDLALVGAGEAA